MVENSRLRAAIIGLGRMGAEPSSRLGKMSNGWSPVSHAESMVSLPEYELAGLCDIDPERVARFQELYSVAHGFTDYKKLIDTIQPDVISIATRTNLKEEIIRYAAQNGVSGIYVEKPLATSISQCQEILEIVKQAGIKLIYGTQRRGMPFFRKAKEMAYSGQWGKVQSVQFEYGASLLLWTLPHLTDLITYYTDCSTLASISAHCEFKKAYIPETTFIDEDPTIHSADITMQNGIRAILTPGKGANIRIHLEIGVININGDGYSIETHTAGEYIGKLTEIQRAYAPESKSGTQLLFADLAQAVKQNQAVTLGSYAEILGSTELLMGMVESGLQNGARIKLAAIRKNLTVTGRFGDLLA